MFSKLAASEITALARLKLALVGLDTGCDAMPANLSMAKRVGLARALALEPDMLFLDEPSAGLDPISSRRLDDLIQVLRDGLGVTVVMVSQDFPTCSPSPMRNYPGCGHADANRAPRTRYIT